MPRIPKQGPIVSEYFFWHLRKRENVYYADGRVNKLHRLGKYSLGTRDREEALRRLRELDRQMAAERGLAKAESLGGDLSIADGWQLYMKRCEQPEILEGISLASQKRYRAVRDKHLEFCEKHGYASWTQIDKKATHDYGAWLAKQKYADRTIVLELNLICSVAKWLVEEDQLPANSRFLLKLSKPDGSGTYCYTRRQVARMIRFCQANENLTWLANVITALATTGLRINELSRLRWSDVDLRSNTIRLTDERARSRKKQSGYERRLKGKRGRALPVNPALRKLLMSMAAHSDGLVFHGQKGGKLRDRQVLQTLQDDVIESVKNEFPTPEGEIGFEDGTVHSFRHYFTSEAYRSGATDAELLEWLGHRDSEIMKLYRHLRTEDSHRRMEQIDFLGEDDDDQTQAVVA